VLGLAETDRDSVFDAVKSSLSCAELPLTSEGLEELLLVTVDVVDSLLVPEELGALLVPEELAGRRTVTLGRIVLSAGEVRG